MCWVLEEASEPVLATGFLATAAQLAEWAPAPPPAAQARLFCRPTTLNPSPKHCCTAGGTGPRAPPC